jgi:hypothetical protein
MGLAQLAMRRTREPSLKKRAKTDTAKPAATLALFSFRAPALPKMQGQR